MAPPSILDYIVVHELAHFIHANHGRDFLEVGGEYYTRL